MVSFSVKTRVMPDGTLQVAIPTGLPEADVEVLVVVRPASVCSTASAGPGTWPEGFFDSTFGCLTEDPMIREPLLQQEARENLL